MELEGKVTIVTGAASSGFTQLGSGWLAGCSH
jgi:hypothetical protein